MDDDPVFYTRFSQLLEEAIKAWKDKRIGDAEYLKKTKDIMDSVLNRKEDLPQALVNKDVAKAFYGIAGKVLVQVLGEGTKATDLSVKIALTVDDLIQSHLRRDWVTDRDAANKMKNDIDDFLFDLKSSENVNLTTQQIDSIIDECINVAKRRYAR
jgi:type I restriction enzyme R subunit